MLVLQRKVGEAVQIGDGVTVTVVDVDGDEVRLGVSSLFDNIDVEPKEDHGDGGEVQMP